MITRVTKAQEITSKDGDISVKLRVNQEWKCIDKQFTMILRRNNVRMEISGELFNTLFEVIDK